MDRTEFESEMKNIGIDYLAEMARVDVPYGATNERFASAEKMRREIEMKYARKQIQLQKRFGVPTPVAFGKTENDV